MVFTFIIAFNSMVRSQVLDSTEGDELTKEQSYLIDDQPTECLGKLYFPDGTSVCDALPDKGKCDQLNKIDERVSLPKSLKSLGVVELQSDAPTRRKITGKQIEVFDSPKGKAIDSYPKNFALLIEGKKDGWVFVRGYWSRNCDTGWVLENELIFKSRKEIETLGAFGK